MDQRTAGADCFDSSVSDIVSHPGTGDHAAADMFTYINQSLSPLADISIIGYGGNRRGPNFTPLNRSRGPAESVQ